MARQFKRARHLGQRCQVQLPSSSFPQANENKGFHLAKQITLSINAFAFPSLKAMGHGTCAPCSAGNVIEMPRGVKSFSLLAGQMALPCFCRRAEATGGRCLGCYLKNSPSPQEHCLKMLFRITTGAKLTVSITS